MRRGIVGVAIVALVVGACGGGGGGGGRTPVTNAVLGPLDPALLTVTQLRQVPGFSTATAAPLQDMTSLEDPDPRGPCGAAVPKLPFTDAVGTIVRADAIRSGAQFVIRLPPGAAESYLDARQANTAKDCPEYETTTRQGVTQRVRLVRIVRLYREFEQALAVVIGTKIGDHVSAVTQIDVRRGDILSRVVIFTEAPFSNTSVRGIASVMAKNLDALAT